MNLKRMLRRWELPLEQVSEHVRFESAQACQPRETAVLRAGQFRVALYWGDLLWAANHQRLHHACSAGTCGCCCSAEKGEAVQGLPQPDHNIATQIASL